MAEPSPGNWLRRLPWLFAAGAVLWLIQLTQFAAVIASPVGRDQLRQALAGAGFHGDFASLLVVETILVVFVEAAAVALHGAAFYGLRRYRPWGWACAVLVSAAWSAILLGIPVLVLLLRRRTRQAYGVP
jgi:hypothetical protein